jgi:hypothetical protein
MLIQYECMTRHEKIERLKELVRPLVPPWRARREKRLQAERGERERWESEVAQLLKEREGEMSCK